jgi:hypothetical protein
VLLREALDGEGGSNIAIDYPVPISHTELNDQNRRGALTAALADLPVSNVWIRASGLDSTSGPLTVKRYLSALSNLHNLGKPIVAGHLDGLVGNAALAFGAISGVAHGIGERERFDASSWHKPPLPRSEDSRFGRATRIGVPGLNRSVTVDEIELLAAAKGGRRLVACSDRNRCPNGHLDMIADPRRHMSRQTFQAIAELQAIPDVKREHYFLNGPMDAADRLARQIKSLKPPASEAAKHKIDIDKLMARLNDHSRKIYQLKTALEQLHDTRSAGSPRAKPVQSRQTKSREIKADRP